MIKATTENGYLIRIPKIFYKYKCLKIIGTGGTSIVVLVEDINKKKWAAKIVSVKDVENRKILNLVEKEIAMLREIDHQNIIKMRESFEITNKYNEEYIIIIMEYCERGDLLTLTTKHKLKDENLIKKIIYGFLGAIKYLHSRGISHGDIKTENILLTENYIPKLCDFGFCRTIFVAGNESKYGTLFYAAPELFYKGKFDPFKTDIYAIGITLYSIFELKFPFIEGDEKEIREQIVNSDLIFKFKTSKKLKNLIVKCTDKEPINRPTIDEIINYDYFNIEERKLLTKDNNNLDKLNTIDEKLTPIENA